MKKFILYFVLLCSLVFKTNAQIKEITNIQTPEHVEIPGTKYLIIPPDETYSVSTDAHGIQNKDKTSAINITEMPMAYEMVVPMFAKDFGSDDTTFTEEDYIINGYNTKLYKSKKLADQDDESSEMIFWIMLYGNKTTTFMLAGAHPSVEEEVLSPKFKKSMLSFMYLEDKNVDPTEGLSFTLDVSGTPLKFASAVMQTGAAYNVSGDMTSKVEDNITYMVMIMPVAIEKEEQEESAIRSVKRPFDDNIKVEKISPITLDGLAGYEVVAYETDENGNTILKYAVKLFEEDKYFDIRGTCESELEERLKMFKQVSKTFKLK